MLFVTIGRDWSLPKYHPRNPAFEFEAGEEDVDDDNERLGNVVERGRRSLEPLASLSRRRDGA